MELETYHWITIGFLFVLFVMSMMSKESILAPDRDDDALKFIYDQCMNETSINLTYSTGKFYLAKENDVCLLKVKP